MNLPHGVESAGARLVALVAAEAPDPAAILAALLDTALGVTSLSTEQLNSLQAVLGHVSRSLRDTNRMGDIDAARLAGATSVVSALVAERFHERERERDAATRHTRIAQVRTAVLGVLHRSGGRAMTPGEVLVALDTQARPDELSRALAALCAHGEAERVEGPDNADRRRRFYRASVAPARSEGRTLRTAPDADDPAPWTTPPLVALGTALMPVS